MFEKFKNLFKEKDDKKKMENLVAFLVILVVTLILVKKILSGGNESKEEMYQNEVGVQLVNNKEEKAVLVDNNGEDELEKNLEEILSKINGVGEVNVLVTYQTDNPSKIEGAIVIAKGAR